MKSIASPKTSFLFIIIFLVALSLKVSAASAVWIGANRADFSASSSWNTGVEPGTLNTTTNTDTATFNTAVTAGTGGVVVDQNGVNLGNITFGANAGPYTIQPNGSFGSFFLSSGGSISNQSTASYVLEDMVIGVVLEPASATSDGTITFSSTGGNGNLNFASYVKGGTTTGKITLTLQGASTGGSIFQSQVSDGGALQGLVINIQSGYGTLGNYGYITSSGGISISSGATLEDLSEYGNPLGSQSIVDNGNIQLYSSYSQTLANSVSGSGSVTVNTFSIISLTGDNSYSGGTLLSGGTLSLGSATAIGTGTITLYGGTLQFTSANRNDYSSQFSTVAGQVFNFDTNGQNVTFASTISGTNSSLTKIGAGTLTLSGANQYSGPTTVTGGSLTITQSLTSSSSFLIASGAALNLTSGSFAVSGTITNSGTLVLSSGVTLSSAGTFTNNGTFDLRKDSSFTLPGNLVNNGYIILSNGTVLSPNTPSDSPTMPTWALIVTGCLLVLTAGQHLSGGKREQAHLRAG